MNFTITNIGKYPVSSVRISKIVHDYENYMVGNTELPVISYLHVGESKKVFQTVVIPFQYQNQNYNHNLYENSYTIKVKWKVEYEYHVKIFYDPQYTFDQNHSPIGPPVEKFSMRSHYAYKNTAYQNKDELEVAIKKDLIN